MVWVWLGRGSAFLDGAQHMYQIIALIVLTLFTGVVAMWASCDESDEPNVAEKPDTSADEHHRKAA